MAEDDVKLRALAEAARPRLGSCCYEAGKPECRCLLVPVRIEADDLLALLDRVEAAEAAVDRASSDALRWAASEMHREARFAHEQAMRGTPVDAMERALEMERVFQNQADRSTSERPR